MAKTPLTTPTAAVTMSSLLLLALAACNGPGPLRSAELRWRWTYGTIIETKDVDDGVWVHLACPADVGDAISTSFTVLTREVREFERRDPLLRRRDPLQLVAWRRCVDAAAAAQPAGAVAVDPAQPRR